MNLEQAANFFACSILIAFALIVLAAMVIAINNLFSRFWKEINWVKFEYQPVYYNAGEKKEPTNDQP